MAAELNRALELEFGTAQRERYRHALVEALTNQAERYRAKARAYCDAAIAKPGSGLEAGAEEYRAMAEMALQMRDQIKEG